MTEQEAIARGLQLSAEIHERLGIQNPLTPEQVFLANLDLWEAFEKEAHERRGASLFKAKNQTARKVRRRKRRERNRNAEWRRVRWKERSLQSRSCCLQTLDDHGAAGESDAYP